MLSTPSGGSTVMSHAANPRRFIFLSMETWGVSSWGLTNQKFSLENSPRCACSSLGFTQVNDGRNRGIGGKTEMQSHRKNVSNPLCYRELLFRCCCFVTSDTFKPFTTGALHSLCRCVSAAREPRMQIDSGLCEPHVMHLTNLRAARSL